MLKAAFWLVAPIVADRAEQISSFITRNPTGQCSSGALNVGSRAALGMLTMARCRAEGTTRQCSAIPEAKTG